MEQTTKLDFSKVSNVQLDDIDTSDYPDFCDAYICDAWYDGAPATDEQMEIINENKDFVYECVINYLF